MHKHLLHLTFLFVAILFVASTVIRAEDSQPWIGSTLNFQKDADTISDPTTINGNIDCAFAGTSCSVSTAYGAATQDGLVGLAGGVFKPVMSFLDGRKHFLPIPNSYNFMTYTTEPPFGVYLYFNYNFADSIK